MRRRAVWPLAALLALASAPALAHPDILMECHLLFNFEGGEITGIGESWTFDETFSAQLLADYDEDHDGSFNEAESTAIGNETFARLGEIHYFTFLTLDGAPLPVPEPFGFKAAAQGGIVTFSFGLRLAAPVAPQSHKLALQIKDPDYAVGASLAAHEAVVLKGIEPGACRAVITSKPEDAYFDGLVIPKEASIVCP
ncbi:DUF1007 family protein [Aureimonas sp. D3]|uniref:DUF1007 family protein n=1 Tax=Aureimonas sp. D3 TaxID=1638164 RepID=UPI00078297A6|nr:DUF1007 family protein [Aureimonas sp. D3]